MELVLLWGGRRGVSGKGWSEAKVEEQGEILKSNYCVHYERKRFFLRLI